MPSRSATACGRLVAASIERDEGLAAADPGRMPQTPTYMALYEAGRRRVEIAALEWPAVHLEGDSPTWEFHETKGSKLSATDDGPERYAIPPRLLPYLSAMKRLHERRLGRPVGDGDRVFPSPEGRPIHGDNLRWGFYRLLQLAGRRTTQGRLGRLTTSRTRAPVDIDGPAALELQDGIPGATSCDLHLRCRAAEHPCRVLEGVLEGADAVYLRRNRIGMHPCAKGVSPVTITPCTRLRPAYPARIHPF